MTSKSNSGVKLKPSKKPVKIGTSPKLMVKSHNNRTYIG